MFQNKNQLELFQEHLNTKGDFSIYKGIKHVDALSAHKMMRDVIKNLTTPLISTQKDVALIGPYKLNAERKRAKENVEAISAFVFDIDDPQEHTFQDIVLLASPYSGILHTTWSHTEKNPRYRLIIHLTSPIASAHFKTMRDEFLNLNPWLASIVDKACSDISRAYYLFSYPQERAEIAQCCVLLGSPINPQDYWPKSSLPSADMQLQILQLKSSNKIDETSRNILGMNVPLIESISEIANLNAALTFISPDVRYGTGSFYDSNGVAETDNWLATIWAMASLNWPSGKEIARKWSQLSSRYTDEGFERAWNSYNPTHANAIGIGSLFKRAKELGWKPAAQSIQVTQPPQRFTLLGISDLGALSPTEHLVKGILPSSGLAAIYGPSGSGKTFLALDLIMAIACQSDWFSHKVKNVPVTYVGLEGKGGINNRIKAWCIKNPSLTPSNFKVILDNFDLMNKANVVELAQAVINTEMHHGVIVIDTLNQASPTADENSSQDMGVIIKHLKLLQEMTEGLVLIIHHTGKKTSQGLRGHSSLKAALDANIEVTGGDKHSWLLEKSKDGEDGKSFRFGLEVQQLGVDSDGDLITSCTVERDHSVIFTKAEPSGSQQKAALKAIKQELAKIAVNRMTVEATVGVIASTLTTISSNKRSNRARQILGSLTNGGYLSSELVKDGGWVWLPQ